MRQITDIEKLKKIQLDILLEVNDFCIAHGIRYSLDSGTLLGAIRHKGYIPWDDDIDIIMPRPDYNRFLKEFNGKCKNLKVFAPELDWDFYAPYANICDIRTILDEGANSHRKVEMGIKIDVFPIDGAPICDSQYYSVLRRIKFLNAILEAKRHNILKMQKKCSFRVVKYIILKVLSFPLSYSFVQKKIFKYSTNIKFEKCQCAAKLSYTWTKNRCNRDVFEEYVDCNFEGFKVKIIKRYDEYLNKLYGNYMQLPPEKDRVPQHGFIAYWKE